MTRNPVGAIVADLEARGVPGTAVPGTFRGNHRVPGTPADRCESARWAFECSSPAAKNSRGRRFVCYNMPGHWSSPLVV